MSNTLCALTKVPAPRTACIAASHACDVSKTWRAAPEVETSRGVGEVEEGTVPRSFLLRPSRIDLKDLELDMHGLCSSTDSAPLWTRQQTFWFFGSCGRDARGEQICSAVAREG